MRWHAGTSDDIIDLSRDIDTFRVSQLWDAIKQEVAFTAGPRRTDLNTSDDLGTLRYAQGYLAGVDHFINILDTIQKRARKLSNNRAQE